MALQGPNGSRPARPVRQREIAERAGVSVSTVSRVLNDVPGISAGLQRRVLAAAAELGPADRAGPRPPIHHVALLATDLRAGYALDPFHGDILAGVEAECRRLGLHLSYAVVDPDADAADLVRRKADQTNIDGFLFLAVDDRVLVERVLAFGVPVAVINAEYPGLAVDTFLPDNEGGAALAVRHLLGLGHRRILHVTHFQRRTIRRRHDTYRAVLAEAGIPPDPALVLDAVMGERQTYAAVKRALAETPTDFTAVFCANDASAIGTMRALREAGRRVPADVSVVGFDDLSVAEFLSPPLTTVRVEREELGALAVRRLLDRATTPTLTPIRVELATRLIERRSTAPPARAPAAADPTDRDDVDDQ